MSGKVKPSDVRCSGNYLDADFATSQALLLLPPTLGPSLWGVIAFNWALFSIEYFDST